MSRMRQIVLFVLVLSLVSCTSSATRKSTSTVTNSPLLSANNPTVSPFATQTPLFQQLTAMDLESPTTLPPSPTKTVPYTPTPTSPIPISTSTATFMFPTTASSPVSVSQRYHCLDIQPISQAIGPIKGTIVFADANSGSSKLIYLWNMETGTQKPLLQNNDVVFDLATSPDGKWLAYRVGNTGSNDIPRILIVDADGQLKTVIPGESRWYSISRWLDNERIVIKEVGKITKESIVINIFTGERQKLPSLASDIYNLFPLPDGSMISYDPTTTYVVYPTDNFQTVLEKIKTHEILARFETVWESIPRWSPDGQRFIIASQVFSGTVPIDYDLYSVNLYGEIQRLTYLSLDNNYIERTSYYWSPNGRYIALWVIIDPQQKNLFTLAILDTFTHEVTNYCITIKKISNFPSTLIWSPNSEELLMNINDPENENVNFSIVVDIDQNWAAKITESLMPVGWMVSP